MLNHALNAEPLVFNAQNTQHIQFKRIAPTQYQFMQNALSAEVEHSASFLLLAFKQKRNVRSIRFDWILDKGELNIADSDQEAQREGDDSVFKIGLMLEGQPQLPTPFTPEWLQQVQAALSFPSEMLVYIVAGALHKSGEHWLNPYNKRVEMIAAQHRELDAGWAEASHEFETPLSVVGLWLMADGDNSQSSFSARIKNIRLE